jgi:hypothetical protein
MEATRTIESWHGQTTETIFRSCPVDDFDLPSGTSIVNGVPVEVRVIAP